MNINDTPETYRIYTVCMSNGSRHQVNGDTKIKIMKAQSSWVEIPNGNLINKNFIVEFKLNFEATRDKVQENADEIRKSIVKS